MNRFKKIYTAKVLPWAPPKQSALVALVAAHLYADGPPRVSELATVMRRPRANVLVNLRRLEGMGLAESLDRSEHQTVTNKWVCTELGVALVMGMVREQQKAAA